MAEDQDKSQQTEEPTAKRLEQAHEHGDTVKSSELGTFILLGGGTLAIAMFGKHPAWDDHIDEIGLTTQSLVYTKRILYSEGIATQLASGAWDQIERSGNAIEFNHHFVWGRGDRSIIGGLWASTDGKGRTRFPMAICFQIEVDTLQALALYWAPLELLGQQCRAATSREATRGRPSVAVSASLARSSGRTRAAIRSSPRS